MPSHQPTAGQMAVQPQFLSSQPSPLAKTSEPNRNKSYDPRKPHITDTPITKSNWYKHVNWLNVAFIVGIPLYGCIQAFWVPLQWRTALFAFVYYFMTGLGVTAGKLQPISSPSRHYTNHDLKKRLPSTMGSHLVLCYFATSNLSCCSWWWSGRRLSQMVGERPPGTSSLYRHG